MSSTPTLRQMVGDLIGTPSVSSTLDEFDQSNLAVVHLLANWLEPIGFSVAVVDIDGKPGKGNLVATRGRGSGGLVLSGHTDTVPLDADLWQSDPFRLTEKNDRWYGLGSSDMKSFFAIVIEALKAFDGQSFQHPLTIVGTADEESSMSGARALSAAELSGARFALIGEPTSLRPVTSHKGIMMASLRIRGKSGHSSNPELGVSALDATGPALAELCAFRADLRARFKDAAFEVEYPTLNLGCIHGGDNPNRICDHVDLAFDIRVLPGMNSTAVLEELRCRLVPGLADSGLSIELDLLHPCVPPFEATGSELIAAMRDLSGFEPQAVAFATEAPFLTDLGLETVVLGPGSIDQAHQPNEYVERQQLDAAVDLVRALIERYCRPR